MSDIPRELDDQRALVAEVRDTLFPDKIGQPLNDPHKAMRVTYHVAWRLKQYGIGLVKAKPGSENNVDGYTSDIVALASGDHWDILVDGHTGAAWPTWVKERNPANNMPIKARWVPAVLPPDGPERNVEEEVKRLSAEVAELRERVGELAGLRDTIIELQRRLQTLEEKPAGAIQLPPLVARGSTSRAFGHGHTVELDVIRK